MRGLAVAQDLRLCMASERQSKAHGAPKQREPEEIEKTLKIQQQHKHSHQQKVRQQNRRQIQPQNWPEALIKAQSCT